MTRNILMPIKKQNIIYKIGPRGPRGFTGARGPRGFRGFKGTTNLNSIDIYTSTSGTINLLDTTTHIDIFVCGGGGDSPYDNSTLTNVSVSGGGGSGGVQCISNFRVTSSTTLTYNTSTVSGYGRTYILNMISPYNTVICTATGGQDAVHESGGLPGTNGTTTQTFTNCIYYTSYLKTGDSGYSGSYVSKTINPGYALTLYGQPNDSIASMGNGASWIINTTGITLFKQNADVGGIIIYQYSD